MLYHREKLLDKIKNKNGLSILHYLVMVVIVAILLMFVVDGYIRHLQDVCRTYDSEEVDEALMIAKIQYIFDGAPARVIYYYDADTKQVYTRDKFSRDDRIDIRGYGRTLAYQNRNQETGAVGVPNRGNEKYRVTATNYDDGVTITRDDITHNHKSFFDNIIQSITGMDNPDGAQFLAISFKDGKLEHARWRGPVLYYYDWTIMTQSEKDQLNTAELATIRLDAPKDSEFYK